MNDQHSVIEGTAAVENQIIAYVKHCPSSKLVLLGYSQGAQIIGDALYGGNGGGFGPVTPPMNPSISDHGERHESYFHLRLD